jgi:hypothetical protein
VSRAEKAGLLAEAREAVIADDILRLAIAEDDRLHVGCTEHGHGEKADGAGVFEAEDEAIGRSVEDAQAVDRLRVLDTRPLLVFPRESGEWNPVGILTAFDVL